MNICGRIRVVVIITTLLGSLLLSFVAALPINAAPANPDSITLHSTRVFQNIFETGDMLFVIRYTVTYAIEPTEPASDTFRQALYGTDGTTLLYDRALNYYQLNVHSIYLDATKAATLTWGSEYRMRVMGNPVYFVQTEGTTISTMTLSAGTHWIEGDASLSKSMLKIHCLDLAAILEDEWAITLLVTTAEGQTLNSLGRIVFTDAIPGLDTAVPSLFQVAIGQLQYDAESYGGSYEADTTMATHLGTQITNAFTGIGEQFSMTGQEAGMIWIAFFALTIAGIVFVGTGNTTAALISTVPVLITGAAVGALPLALLYVLAIILVIYMMYHIWLRGM